MRTEVLENLFLQLSRRDPQSLIANPVSHPQPGAIVWGVGQTDRRVWATVRSSLEGWGWWEGVGITHPSPGEGERKRRAKKQKKTERGERREVEMGKEEGVKWLIFLSFCSFLRLRRMTQ